jgi:hypothetical protein
MISAAIFLYFFQEHNLMIKNKMALLGAVATLGMLGGGFVSPAQAIVYNVSGQLADGNTLGGSFDYSSNSYSNWNISITGGTLAANYTTASSFVSTSGTGTTSDASNLILALNGSDFNADNYQLLRLTFADALTGTYPNATTLVQGSFPGFNAPVGSITSATGNIGNGSLNLRETINSTPSSVTAVPWETDALSVIGATTLFGFGVWTKRKRKVDLSK